MYIHEYQAKSLLAKYGIPVPKGAVTSSPARAKKIALQIGGDKFVVKAQIHAGGRGKAGGIQIAHSPNEVQEKSAQLLKKRLVTYQTGPEGKKVRKVLIEKGENIKKEYYLGITLDRSKEKIAVIASLEGGVDIEEVARRSPDKLMVEYVDHPLKIPDYKSRKISRFLGIDVTELVKNLFRMFVEKDCSLCEINPLALTEDGRILALDAKITFDDNALYRHEDIRALYDPHEDDIREAKAKKIGISYVGLDGDIGCLVNGAGLAMATMDEILLAGGSPSNFLDVGGGTSGEQIKEALSLLLSDKRVKVVFVNIFGGIVRCDLIANALIQAVKEIKRDIPIVIRLEGTNHEIALKMIQEANLKNLTIATSIREGAEICVKKVEELRQKTKKSRRKEEMKA